VFSGDDDGLGSEHAGNRALAVSVMSSVCVFAPVSLLSITIEAAPDGEAELHIHAGGQGVWMARAIVALGGEVTLCTPLGGEAGRVIEHILGDEGIQVAGVPSMTASPTWIQDRLEGNRVPLWEGKPGPLTRHDADELYSETLAAAIRAGTCLLAGSHGSTAVLPPDLFRRLTADLRAAGVRIVADISGGELDDALSGGGVDLLKLSAAEALRDGAAETAEEQDLWHGIDRLRDRGAHNLVLSRSEEPSLAMVDGDRYLVTTPQLEVNDDRGAGDALSAALALGLARNLGWDAVLRLGAATATMSVTRHGSGSARAEAVEALTERVGIEAVT
jgi:1-phosphofructokinase